MLLSFIGRVYPDEGRVHSSTIFLYRDFSEGGILAVQKNIETEFIIV
jgi:hypothetical protein